MMFVRPAARSAAFRSLIRSEGVVLFAIAAWVTRTVTGEPWSILRVNVASPLSLPLLGTGLVASISWTGRETFALTG